MKTGPAVPSAGPFFMKIFLIVLSIVVAAVGLTLLYLYNPAESGFFPVCLFRYFTGLPCPGCGFQRSMHQLLHGHFLESLYLCPYAYFQGSALLALYVFPEKTKSLGFALFVVITTFVYAILRICGCVP